MNLPIAFPAEQPLPIDIELLQTIRNAHKLLARRRRETGDSNEAEEILREALEKYDTPTEIFLPVGERGMPL